MTDVMPAQYLVGMFVLAVQKSKQGSSTCDAVTCGDVQRLGRGLYAELSDPEI